MIELPPPARQRRLVAQLKDAIGSMLGVDGAVLIGSLAAGTADALSDVDVFICVTPGQFDIAWSSRRRLHLDGSIVDWDERQRQRSEIGTHRWVTRDVVLVEALFATPAIGARLAPPWTLLVGDAELADRYPHGPPIDRSEFDTTDAHPIDLAFESLKTALRRHARHR